MFSALCGYLLGAETPLIYDVLLLVIGGLFVTGSANAFNQIIEKEEDKLMRRTQTRPLPSKKLSSFQSLIFAFSIGIIGLYFLFLINIQCSFFGLLSLLVYVVLYTPLKKVSPIAIFVGALPGAIPCLLGWVAATDDFGLAAGILFAIQFFWQFPHFIAISLIFADPEINSPRSAVVTVAAVINDITSHLICEVQTQMLGHHSSNF